MSLDTKGIVVEVWPVAADPAGVWLCSGTAGAWTQPVPLAADAEPHDEARLVLGINQVSSGEILALHSTSWRSEDQLVLTYVAVLAAAGGHVRSRWPQALPVSIGLAAKVGRPIPHQPTGQPTPRHFDVLMHAVRHLAFLRDTDAGMRLVLDDNWLRALEPLTPVLAGMYQDEDQHRSPAEAA